MTAFISAAPESGSLATSTTFNATAGSVEISFTRRATRSSGGRELLGTGLITALVISKVLSSA
jgi:hypothetical protein